LDRENIIALFPGSRKKDIIRNLPLQLQSVSTISDVRIFVSVSFEAYIPLVEKIAKQNAVQITVVLPKDRFALMRLATMAIAKFGTISLELALSLTPTVMMIQLDAFTAFLFKYFFRFSLPFYALPNILLQKPVFQEIIINASGESALKKAVTDLFYSSEKQVLQKDLCQQVKALFENMDPGERAATEILTLI
jgi:lipid-A-disaccharide synthase